MLEESLKSIKAAEAKAEDVMKEADAKAASVLEEAKEKPGDERGDCTENEVFKS